MLRTAEEVIVLMTDENSTRLHCIPESRSNLMLSGAVLIDLALENRITMDPQRLILTDPAPLDDPLLDPALLDMAATSEEHDTSFWLRRISASGEEIRGKALARLVERGILDSAEDELYSLSGPVSRTRFYPLADDQTQEDIKLRIMRALFTDETPTPQDIAIISLINASGQFDKILTTTELEGVQERINVLTHQDPIGRVVADAIQYIADEPEATDRPRSQTSLLPAVGGSWPLLGNAIALLRQGNKFFLDNYLKYGPVYRFKALNQNMTVMAGEDANRFLAKNGAVYFDSYWTWRSYHQDLGAKRDIVSMDGTDHSRLRKTLAPGYAIEQADIEAIISTVRDEVRKWQTKSTVSAFNSLQRIVILALSKSVLGYSADEHADALIRYFEIIMNTRMAKSRPKFLYSRQFKKLLQRVHASYDEVLDLRLSDGRTGKERDLADRILELHRVDPQFMPETDMISSMMAPLFTGLETSALTASFAICTLIQNPDLLSRVRAEADDLFDNGTLDLNRLRNMDVTYRVALETLRMFPSAVAAPRTAANTFDFNGYRIGAGQKILIAFSITHFLEEHFPNPERFDIDRFTPERAEHKQRYAYVPFGLGHHRCLAAGLADLLMLLIPATVIHEADLSLLPQNYEVKRLSLPPLQTKSFRIRATPRTA